MTSYQPANDRMTTILGISAFYHDSAAALIQDGDVIAAVQEERFSRRKHDAGFPSYAIKYCLKRSGLERERRRRSCLLREADGEV